MSTFDNLLEAGLVDEALEYQALQENIRKLNNLVESTKPVCPVCKTVLTPFNYRGYYDEHVGYTCNCDTFEFAEEWTGAYT